MNAGHQLLGVEGGGQLHQHLVAPRQHRQQTPRMLLLCSFDIAVSSNRFSTTPKGLLHTMRVQNFFHLFSSLLMTSEWPLVKLESFQLLRWSTHPDSKQGLATPLSSCSSLTSSTWLVQQRLLPTMSKNPSPSGLELLTVGDFWPSTGPWGPCPGVLPSPCFPNFLARTTFVLESLPEAKNPGQDAFFWEFCL